jgi:hypothetical protein
MTNVIRHNLTTGWWVCVLGVPAALLLGTPRINGLIEDERLQTASMAPVEQANALIRNELAASSKGSRIPLDLVLANRCTPVELTSNGQDPDFLPGTTIAAETPNGQPIPAGTFVCSATGQSAVVAVNNTLTNVQFTSLELMPEYKEAWTLMLDYRNRQM